MLEHRAEHHENLAHSADQALRADAEMPKFGGLGHLTPHDPYLSEMALSCRFFSKRCNHTPPYVVTCLRIEAKIVIKKSQTVPKRTKLAHSE